MDLLADSTRRDNLQFLGIFDLSLASIYDFIIVIIIVVRFEN